MIDPTETDIGRKVVYRAAPRFDREEGTITSFNNTGVFVQYGASAQSQLTRREDLEWAGMTPEQFERWSDFAKRMAVHGWPDATEARKQKILDAVDCFLWQMEDLAADIESWDCGKNRVYVCDEMDRFYCENWHAHQDGEHTKFETQIHCCVRAGLDVAVMPSAGVLGFDVGMLRRMWDGDLPAWVAEWFQPALTAATPDTKPVWL